jgi:hypothetical protein
MHASPDLPDHPPERWLQQHNTLENTLQSPKTINNCIANIDSRKREPPDTKAKDYNHKIEGPKSCKPDSYFPIAKCRSNSTQPLGSNLYR